MPVITRTIEFEEQSQDVTSIQKDILLLRGSITEDELFKENVDGIYRTSTRQALINVLQRFGGSDIFGPPFNASWGRMLHMAAAAEVGNSGALHAAVQECFDARHIPPSLSLPEQHWLARFATIARNFTVAKSMIQSMSNPDDDIRQIVTQNSLQPTQPELLNPENYYTFVYDYVSRADIKAVMQSNKVRNR